MPALLIRINQVHDCISEFESAAAQRYREALALLHTRNSYAAIYLLGYSVEMWIKAAYFRNEGTKSAATAITMGDLHNAWNHQNAAGIQTKKDLHDFAGWAKLLTYIRNTSIALPPYSPQLSLQIIKCANIVREHWDPKMRYRHLRLRPWEAKNVLHAATWFKDRYNAL